MSKLEKLRPRCFFDVSIDDKNVGRIIFELFNETCPKTCENFKALCTGEKGLGKTTGKLLHYKNVTFHRIINGFMIQSGDFSQMNGKGGESIYGGTFADESFHFKHDRPFLLSMANRGPNTNGSQFFITLVPTPHLDGVHVVFGHVITGKDVVMKIAEQPVDKNSRPKNSVKISNCGELVPKIIPKNTKKNSDSESNSSSSDSDDSDSNSDSDDSNESNDNDDNDSKISKNEQQQQQQQNENVISLFNPKYSVKIDPNEIPEIPLNRFLQRNSTQNNNNNNNNDNEKSTTKNDNNRYNHERRHHHHHQSKRYTRSGRKIKGRGTIHYRTPSPDDGDDRNNRYNRSSNNHRHHHSYNDNRKRRERRSETPLHWRVEQAKIKSWKEIISETKKPKNNDDDKRKNSRSHSRSRSIERKNNRRKDEGDNNRKRHRDEKNNDDENERRKFREYPSSSSPLLIEQRSSSHKNKSTSSFSEKENHHHHHSNSKSKTNSDGKK